MKVVTKSNCPLCGSAMKFDWETKEIPHFGEAMIIAGICDGCNFRLTDTILLGQHDPSRYTFTIECPEDLNARVIRSTSGTVRVPELGIDVEPGPASEAYISNIEGVLQKIRGVVSFATKSAKDAGAMENVQQGEHVLDCIDRAIEGQRPLTIILEDPMGNSAIVSEKAVTKKLTKEECEELETGMVILECNA